MSIVRDGIWLWGHEAGSHNSGWRLPGASAIAPTDAAAYMGIPHLIMVVYGGKPEPPFDAYARPFRILNRVVWSIIGDAGSTRNDTTSDLDPVIDLSTKLPNITGAIMDDIFHQEPDVQGRISRVTVEQLAEFRDRLHAGPKPLDLWAVLYSHDLRWPVKEYMDLCDVVTFWTWHAKGIALLEESLARLEDVVGPKRKVLGCYMWDYGACMPMPVETMQHQCDLGSRWLREGRIEGMIFLASCICDLGLEAVEWTRRWIDEVGDQPV